LYQIVQGNLTYEVFKQISIRFSRYGLTWEKGYYVPTAVFAFVNPLAYVIGNKDLFLNAPFASEDYIEATYMAQAILLK